MRIVTYNDEGLVDSEIDEVVVRVKGLIINSKNEIMLGYCNKTYQFPGGHMKDGEKILDCLMREIKEETGIILDKKSVLLIEKIIYYVRNYRDTGKNRKNEIYYYLIRGDFEYDLDKMELDEMEKEGNYTLEMVEMSRVRDKLVASIPDNPINKIIVVEMLDVLGEYEKNYGFR